VRAIHACTVSACCLLLAGCSGRARIELASLAFNSIDPPPPRTTRVNFNECYWWTDSQDRVRIAMRRVVKPLLIPLAGYEFQLSLVLERLPAGRARNYQVGLNALRGWAHVGPFYVRFASRQGIAALYREPGEGLRGSLRLHVQRQVSRLLGGWGASTRYLMFGALSAVHDERRGRDILERFERSAAPAQPASRPATSPARARPTGE